MGIGLSVQSANAADDPSNRRVAERLPFQGAEVFLFLEWFSNAKGAKEPEKFTLRIKDLSLTGISGLTDAPIGPGDLTFVQLEETLIPAAQVVWFRRTLVAFQFTEALEIKKLKRLKDQHDKGQLWSPAMRSRSDLSGWWTNVVEHERGRQAVFRPRT
jgi:hypothetical protein